MRTFWKLAPLAVIAVSVGLAACSEGPATGAGGSEAEAGLPTMVAYRSPTCGCCELWVEHMRAAGFRVDVEVTNDMDRVKSQAGVPPGGGSCHTAHVGDYFVEGHVPAADVKRLLAEKPDARGLTVPGMVKGSPGMEQGGIREPYDVLLVGNDGSTSIFASHW